MTRVFSVAVLVALLLAASSDPPGTEVIVVFNAARFDPRTVEVRRGARVTFHNVDAGEGTCSIVASDGSFESRPLGRDAEWTHRFLTAGEHGYFLKEHPETRGRVIVK